MYTIYTLYLHIVYTLYIYTYDIHITNIPYHPQFQCLRGDPRLPALLARQRAAAARRALRLALLRGGQGTGRLARGKWANHHES